MLSEQRIKELERAESKLNALECGGVDNWEFYENSLEDWNKENEIDEQREDLINELSIIFGECAYEPSERGAGIAFRDDVFKSAIKLLTEKGVIFK